MKKTKTMDGNTAAAYISYAFTEVAAIYPITPSSTMAELVDDWSSKKTKNIFGEPVKVVEMQSEAGAAGTVHGSLKTGVLTSTYTASQGLLLMIPNMYKIAGELLPTVFHVTARAIATNALSIFGDHSDVMATRQTGFAMLCEGSVQEVMDLSGVAHLASIESSLPFLNFFDGFRTSHELQKIEVIDYDDLKGLVDYDQLEAFRKRGLNPNTPTVSGTAQNPDIYFQSRETVNQHYIELPKIVQKYMKEINAIRGTDYDLTTYYGHEEATEVIISMGSATPTIRQTVDYLNGQGRKVGHIAIHLYRPFPTENLLEKLPKTVEKVAVLDRTKEPGSDGEPLFLDVQSALYEHSNHPLIIGGRYGIGSKDVTPNQIVSVFDHLLVDKSEMKRRFTIGIEDDLTHLSLPMTPVLDLTPKSTFQGKFWGFGSDGTVGANKQAIKIIGDHTDQYAQAYFSYDSKKSGGLTVSHLRFGEEPINSIYLVEHPDFVGCHNAAYIHKYDLIKGLKKGGTFLLNTVWSEEKVLKLLPKHLKQYIGENDIQFYIINAMDIAQEEGLGRRINTVMSTAFFELTGLMPREEYLPLLKEEIKATYGKKSSEVVERNWRVIDKTFDALVKVAVPSDWASIDVTEKKETTEVPAYVRNIVEPIERQEGNSLSVKTLIDNGMLGGNMPLGTAAYEKRGIALEVPEWIPEACTMCNECAFVCPHAAIRPFLANEEEMSEAPAGYITRDFKGKDGLNYRIQVSVEDCTGCGLCVEACPAKEKALIMRPFEEQQAEAINWAFSMTLKYKENPVKKESVKGSQFEQPLLEFSGACSGCGETPYVKLLTQLFGDRMMVANTTGCSSIWGASAPTTPYTTNQFGQGPAWSNSLFEDNAEFGFGMYVANQVKRNRVADKIEKLVASQEGSPETRKLMEEWLAKKEEGQGTRQRATRLLEAITQEKSDVFNELATDSHMFVKPSQWMIGGDGWAYDIGFGGIDHVLASGEDINILVMDNELYANTGGQMSKATSQSAVAKFAASGKKTTKKDLGMMAATYGNVYVAQISINAHPNQAIKAITEAENYPGPSLIIGYTPCINHGIKGGMSHALLNAQEAVESGYWQLYRYDPRLAEKGKDPMRVDYKKADTDKIPEFLETQTRFSSLINVFKDEGKVEEMYDNTKEDVIDRRENYERLSQLNKK